MDTKTEYVEKLSAQMMEWDVQLDLLAFNEDSAADEAKSAYHRQIEVLLHKRKEAELKLQAVSDADDDVWLELKAGTDSIWDEFRTSLHDAILNTK